MYGADVPQLGDRSGTGFSDPHVFDGMQTPSFCPTLQGRVLNVVIHQVKHSVPIDVLNHLFSSYGVVEKIFLSSNQHGRTILIQYQHDYMADNALRATHGWYLYSTYCQLDVRHADPADLQILYDYSCAVLSEINTSEQKLTHEVAMPKVEAIDDLYSVTPHLKGRIIQPQPHVIQEMLAQVQANLAAISENLIQDFKHMKQSGERTWDCSKQTAASQPNPPTLEVIKVFDETPTYDVYDDEVSDCSNGFINVLDVNFEQQQDEEGKQDIEDTSNYLSKASENEISSQQPPMSATATDHMQFQAFESMPNFDEYAEEDSACLNIISDVRDFTLELQQQDDDRACNCPVIKAPNSSATRSSQLSIEHSMRELRLLWDPGASTPLHSSKSKPPGELSSVTIVISKVLNLCNHVGIYVQQLRDPSWNVLVVPQRRKEWDPGEHTIFSSTLNRDIVGVLQTSILTTSGIFTLPYVLAVRIKFGVSKCCVPEQCYCRVPSRLINHGIQFLWDPGILSLMDIMLSETTVPNLMDLKHFWAQLLLQYHSWCTTPNTFLPVQDSCLPLVLACLYSEPFKQLVCYSSIFSSTAMYMSTATNVCMRLVLSSGKIAQAEKDAADVYQVLKIQLPMKKTYYVWDPGVKISLYSRLNILTVWSATDKQLSCTHIPDLAAWPNQSGTSSASYIMNPGTMLLQYRLLFTEEKEMVTLIPEQCSLRFNAMHYCQIFEKCINGIALWLISLKMKSF